MQNAGAILGQRACGLAIDHTWKEQEIGHLYLFWFGVGLWLKKLLQSAWLMPTMSLKMTP